MDIIGQYIKEAGDAVISLYNLDIMLSNQFIGDGGRHDKLIAELRKPIQKAMDELSSKNWPLDMAFLR